MPDPTSDSLQRIRDRIANAAPSGVWARADFLDIGTPNAVEKASLDGLEKRYRALIRDISDDKRAPDLIAAVLKQGALERGDAHFALKTSERTAKNTLSDLVQRGFLKSDTPKLRYG